MAFFPLWVLVFGSLEQLGELCQGLWCGAEPQALSRCPLRCTWRFCIPGRPASCSPRCCSHLSSQLREAAALLAVPAAPRGSLARRPILLPSAGLVRLPSRSAAISSFPVLTGAGWPLGLRL